MPSILGNLHIDGNGDIFEQSVAITYSAAFHDPIIAAVPDVVVNTAGGTTKNPVAQQTDSILSASRTAFVSVLGDDHRCVDVAQHPRTADARSTSTGRRPR